MCNVVNKKKVDMGIFDEGIFYTDDVYNKSVSTTKKKHNTKTLNVDKINAMLAE